MLKTPLFPFQAEAYNKLIKLKVGALYLEMGLGKTRTTLELVQRRFELGKIDRVLWFCPCSTKTNLVEQIKTHSNLLTIIDIVGLETISLSDKTYTYVYDLVKKYKYMLVIDESNFVKNHRAIRSKRIITISNFCKYRLLLNGTPITRNEMDFYSQWFILDWRILGYSSFNKFSKNHLVWDEKRKKVVRVLNADYLTNRIAPFSYSVSKKDFVNVSKKHYTVFFEMEFYQKKHYNRFVEFFSQNILKEENLATIYMLLNCLQHITSGRKIKKIEKTKTLDFFQNKRNPRIKTLLKTLEKIPAKEKIIIWCKYTKEIEEIHKVLSDVYGANQISLLYGGLTQREREIELEKFKRNTRFLLGNKKTGGYGLNLQIANFMIFYNNDFDWGTRLQAEDRIHRIGQKNNCTYIDLVAKDTIDVQIIKNLQKKENLVDKLKKLLEEKKLKKIPDFLKGGDIIINSKKIKSYTGNSVYDETKKRIEYLFDEFDNICLSFSGGKDSGVCLNLMIDEARKRKRKFGVLHIDVEAQYQHTVEFIKEMIESNLDVIIPFWICLPMESPNSLSYLDPTWIWWDKEKKPIWVRDMPKMDYVITEDNNPLDFYYQNMPFEEFIKHFGTWYGKGEKTAVVVGIRTQESLNRFRAIANNKNNYLYKKWIVELGTNSYNCYPIYDWITQDIWVYNGKFNKLYNKIYDLFYKAGISIEKMRIDEPFGNEAKAGLSLFKVIEPQTWAKVVNRVSGANFGNIYHNTKITKANYTLPKNHSWKSFTKFLLKTLPEHTRNHYLNKFIKFIKYWHRIGCGVSTEMLEKLEKEYSNFIECTGEISTRGSKDKIIVKFKKLPDEMPGLDTKKDFPSWKRLSMVIIKNDYVCKSLSFAPTKDLVTRQGQLLEKYKNL